MGTRHRRHALVALVVVGATIGLLAPPASANDAELTGGTIDYYASDSSLYESQDFGSSTTQCSTPSSTFDITATHAWTVTTVEHISAFFFFSSHYSSERTTTITGTSSSSGVMAGTSSITEVRYPNSSTCAATPPPNPCTFTITNIAVAGSSNILNGDAEVSDVATLSGDSGDHGTFTFNLMTSGNCGGFTSLDDGSVVITDMAIHITT